MSPLIKKLLPHFAAILIFLGITAAFFSPQLEGKVLFQNDINQWRGMAQEMHEYKKETGNTLYWTNSMFGGMPTYQINRMTDGNTLSYIKKAFSLSLSTPIGVFFTSMFCFYIFALTLRTKNWLGILGAITFGFATNNFVLYEAGHSNKLWAIAYLPLIAAGIITVLDRKYLWGTLIFALGFGLNIMSNHVQMTYLFVLTFPFLAVPILIKAGRTKDWAHISKAAGALIIGGILALGANAINILPTQEYADDTMRGTPILKVESQAAITSSSQTDGLEWNYAMQWSNNSLDLLSGIIPSIVGGGSGQHVSSNSSAGKILKKAGLNVKNPMPMYWGALPFTSGPIYFGAVIFFLFILGLLIVKHPFKWWLAGALLLTAMLSLGKNLEWFNRFVFDYIPLYNKFRTPNSVLSITPFFLSAMACMAIARLLEYKSDEDRKQQVKHLYIATGISSSIAAFFLLMGPSMFSFEGLNPQTNIDAIIQARKAMMTSDALRTLLFILGSAATIWLYLKNKLSWGILIGVLAMLALIDMWGVGKRYLPADKFKKQRGKTIAFEKRPADDYILKQEKSRGDYRVLDMSTSTFQSAQTSYYHNSLGGYHAGKLQRAQDMVDRYWSQNIQQIGQALQSDPTPAGLNRALLSMPALNMMNVKYLILDPSRPAAENQQCLGAGWVVQDIKLVNSPNEEIGSIRSINPRNTAIIHKEFSDYVAGLGSAQGTVELISYLGDHLTYNINMSGEGLVVFSEVWYGPDKGWDAYIDGNKVDHIRANYLLRALRVPAGQHRVEFKFEPSTVRAGIATSFIGSLLIILGLLAMAFLWFKENKDQLLTAQRAYNEKRNKKE